MTIEQALALALQHHQAGRLAEAEALYRQILAAEPRNADALHLLGVVARQVGQNDVAVDLIRQALALRPNFPEAYSNLGNALRDKGQLDKAVAAYRQAIAVRPNFSEAYSNLGNALRDKGLLDEAVAAYRQAIAISPDFSEAHNNLGTALQDKGQLDKAVAAYRQAIALMPNYPEAYSNLGNALRDKGQLDEAISACRQAIALRPNFPEPHNNLGTALRDKGHLDEAIATYRQAVALKTNFSEAYYNLGIALNGKGHLEGAIAAYRQAVALKPNYPEAYNNLGNALRDKGQLDEAVAAYRQTIGFRPNDAEAHSNLGIALRDKGQPDEAIAAHRQAIALKPDLPEAHSNLGNALRDIGQLDQAVAAFRQAIALKADCPEAHSNLGLALLVQGDFLRGWEEYEWRWKVEAVASRRRNFTQPPWDGGPLDGRTLLLHTEQGFGDAIQFIRYVPRVASGDGNIIIACQPELQRLFQTMAPGFQVLTIGQTLPAFDIHRPLLSLPRIFSTDLGNIPRTVPYLHAAAAAAALWRERFAGLGSLLKVGLVWAGRPTHLNDRSRSLKLASLAPLAEVPGVRFISLQKGDAAAEAKALPAVMELIDTEEDLKDFADTAALLANLDLVIAADTAVVHLAGAMGTPVWTLLPFAPDWRWLLDRSDSPWYPTMRLFRQPSIGDWASVIAEVREQLRLWVHSRNE